MEKEIYWSKDVETDTTQNRRANNPTVTCNNASQNFTQPARAQQLTKIVNSPSNLKPRASPALRTSSPIHNPKEDIGAFIPQSSSHYNPHHASSQKLANDRRNANFQCNAKKKPGNIKSCPPKGTAINWQANEISTETQGSSFKSLRSEDKLKLASLIQELATLTEEHDLLKTSLDRHTETHSLEKVAFQKETRKLYQEREMLIQQQHALQQKLIATVEELELLKGRETSRSSVCLQTSPRPSVKERSQQENAPALNTSLNTSSELSNRSNSKDTSSSKRRAKSSQNAVKSKSDNSCDKVEISVQTETDEPLKDVTSSAEPKLKSEQDRVILNPYNDVGLQPVEVLSRTEDCFSTAGSNLRSTEMHQMSVIEKETLALKKKIIEQEKLLALKRKQIDLQHEIHNQEVSAFRANKAASEDNVRNWVDSLPNSPYGEEESSNHRERTDNRTQDLTGPKVTFQEEGDASEVHKNELRRIRNGSRSNSRSRSISPDKKRPPKENGKPQRRTGAQRSLRDRSSSIESSPDNQVNRRSQLNAKRSESPNMPVHSNHSSRKPDLFSGKYQSVKPKVDSHYKPVRQDLELLPNETTDDLLLEAAGKLMHCRKMIDRSEGQIDRYQYTKYMEAMERNKLQEKMPIDNQFDRKYRRNLACERSNRLIRNVQPQKTDHATDKLQPLFKLVDYMDDKVEKPRKLNTAAVENIATFTMEYSPERDLRPSNRSQRSAYNSRLSRPTNRNRSSSFGRLSSRSRSQSRSRDLVARSGGLLKTHLGGKKPAVGNGAKSKPIYGNINTSTLTSELDSDETELFDQVFFVK